jgi:hypothetical protein
MRTLRILGLTLFVVGSNRRDALLRRIAAGILAITLLASSRTGEAGSIFLTGHDPDFHALLGNTAGAQNINRRAIAFIVDPAFNPFRAVGVKKLLFVESNIPVPGGHLRGKGGIVASGFVEGVDFEHHDATTLTAELNLLGTKYSGIVVASDFGGTLTQAELDIFNARAPEIIAFLNAGGGIYAWAESNSGTHLKPTGGHYDFLPIVASNVPQDAIEVGLTVTVFGQDLGISDSDVNGNFYHTVFTELGGLNAVGMDPAGQILSIAGRQEIVICPPGNLAPAFVAPTPTCGSVIEIPADQTLTLGVSASDPDGANTVALSASALPPGATLTPTLPTTGNPVSTQLFWTPSASDAGNHSIVFSATDNCAAQTQCSITLRVVTLCPDLIAGD